MRSKSGDQILERLSLCSLQEAELAIRDELPFLSLKDLECSELAILGQAEVKAIVAACRRLYLLGCLQGSLRIVALSNLLQDLGLMGTIIVTIGRYATACGLIAHLLKEAQELMYLYLRVQGHKARDFDGVKF